MAPKYPLDQALAQIAVTSREYDPAHERWLLGTKSGLWLIDRMHAEFHAGLGAREYGFLAPRSGDPSTAASAVPFWFLPESLPEGLRAAVSARTEKYQPESAMGLHFTMPAGEVLALADDLSKLGLRVVLSDFQLHPVLSVVRAE